MSYNPVNWVNGETPINDTNLNNMDKGIFIAHEILAEHNKKIDNFANEQIPEEYVKGAVDNYISENQAGLVQKENLEETTNKLYSEIAYDFKTNNRVGDYVKENNLAEIETPYISATFEINKNGRYYDNGYILANGSVNSDTLYFMDFFTIKANTPYTIIVENLSAFDSGLSLYLYKKDSVEAVKVNGKNFATSLKQNGYYTFVADITEDMVCRFGFYKWGGVSANNLSFNLYVVEGALTAEDIYKDNEAYILNNLNDLASVSDYVRKNNLFKMRGKYNSSGVSVETNEFDSAFLKVNGNYDTKDVIKFSSGYLLKANVLYTVLISSISTPIPSLYLFLNDNEGKTLGSKRLETNGRFTVQVENDTEVAFSIWGSESRTLEDVSFRLYMVEGAIGGEVANFDYSKYGLPVLDLVGNTSGISKDDAVTLAYAYNDMTGTCTLKWQGSSSLMWEKKNYTIKFDNAFEAKEGWGVQKKYCLKANYIDFSHARNVVSAKLWGQMVESRSVANGNLASCPNYGAVDGFPVLVVINGVYQGIYTFNIPKDIWCYGNAMYVMSAEDHVEATRFKEIALCDGSDFEIEYIENEDNSQQAIDSLNTLINAVMGATGSSFESAIENYLDVDSAIDYFIFACLICGVDITDKNYILSSYDGVKWLFNAYDLDSTFGNHYYGTSYYKSSGSPTFQSYKELHRVMHLIYTYAPEKLKSRYAELRAGVLSEENILYTFSNFILGIPKACYDEEVKVWKGIAGTSTNNLTQIMNFYRLRCQYLDNEINNL